METFINLVHVFDNLIKSTMNRGRIKRRWELDSTFSKIQKRIGACPYTYAVLATVVFDPAGARIAANFHSYQQTVFRPYHKVGSFISRQRTCFGYEAGN